MRLDELAQRAGVPTTTIRLYQNKGLLPGPRIEGRTGYYGETHLARLGLIARLQEEGFSLAAIGKVLETWEAGGGIDDLVGVEHQLDQLLRPATARAVVLDPAEVLARFPSNTIDSDAIQRAAALGLVEPTEDGRLRIPDERFLEAGSALAHLGVPIDVVLDEWAALTDATDAIADRFISVFEDHLATDAATLRQLRLTARQVVAAALDQSLSRRGAPRLADRLAGDGQDDQ